MMPFVGGHSAAGRAAASKGGQSGMNLSLLASQGSILLHWRRRMPARPLGPASGPDRQYNKVRPQSAPCFHSPVQFHAEHSIKAGLCPIDWTVGERLLQIVIRQPPPSKPRRLKVALR